MTIGIVPICLVSCGGNNSDKARIAELEAQINELKGGIEEDESVSGIAESNSTDNYSSNSPENTHRSERGNSKGFVGTYQFTDEYNTTWTLNLKRDESVTVKAKGQNGEYYGSWDEFPYDVPCLSFGYKDSPIVAFPTGDENLDYGIITNEYIYASNVAYKAKNPQKRLPIKKIK